MKNVLLEELFLNYSLLTIDIYIIPREKPGGHRLDVWGRGRRRWKAFAEAAVKRGDESLQASTFNSGSTIRKCFFKINWKNYIAG